MLPDPDVPHRIRRNLVRPDPLVPRRRRVHIHHHPGGAQPGVQSRQQGRKSTPAPETVDLHGKHIPEFVDDQPAQGIAVRMDRAEGIRLRRQVQRRQPKVQSPVQQREKVGFRHRILPVVQHPQRHPGIRVEKPVAEEPAVPVVNVHPIPRRRPRRCRIEHGGIKGRMVTEGPQLDPGLQPVLGAHRGARRRRWSRLGRPGTRSSLRIRSILHPAGVAARKPSRNPRSRNSPENSGKSGV